jgi:hypothetical protein
MFKRKTMVIDDEDNILNSTVKPKSNIEAPQTSINKDKINLIKNQIKSSSNKPKPEIVNKIQSDLKKTKTEVN